MTEQSIAVLLNHPLAAVVVAALVAGITAALTVKMLVGQPAAATAASAGGGMRAPMPAAAAGGDNRAVIAAIAGAIAATGAMRVVYIGEAPSVSGWATELRSRHHSSHAPQSTNH